MTTPSPKPSVIERVLSDMTSCTVPSACGWRREKDMMFCPGCGSCYPLAVAVAIHQTRYTLAVILREMPEELVNAGRERAELATGVFSIAGAINGVADWLDQQA